MAGADRPAISYKSSVAKDLSRLDRAAAIRIVGKIERALGASPDPGSPLKGEFEGLFRLRVGNYRIIYTTMSTGYLILRIGHRREVYRKGRP